MVAHVYEQAKKSKSLNDVIVAIDSKETAEALKKLKIKYVMTSNDHVSGTDRVQEAVSKQDVEIVVNIQADEPSIDPNLIDILVAEFDNENIEMATIAGRKIDAKSFCDPNTVKVLLDRDRFAVNFRRYPIESEAGGYYHHMGIYAYRKAMLEVVKKNRKNCFIPITGVGWVSYLDDISKNQLDQLDTIEDGEFEILDLKFDKRNTKN